MTFTSPRDKVLQDLDAAKLAALLAKKKISQEEYNRHCPEDDCAELLDAIGGLDDPKAAKAAKAKLRKGHPCDEIEEVEAYKGTRMFKLFFVDSDGKRQQCCKLGEVKLGTIASAVNAGMFKTAKIHVPKG